MVGSACQFVAALLKLTVRCGFCCSAVSSQGPQPVSSSASPAAARSVDKLQRSSLLRAAHLRRIRAKAEDESRKVDEVFFINNLTTAGKKADLQQRLEEGEGLAQSLSAVLTQYDTGIEAVHRPFGAHGVLVDPRICRAHE